MALQVKCIFCGNQVDKDKAISYAPRRYVCSDKCHKDYDAKLKYKPQPPNENGEASDRRKMSDYIESLYLNNGFQKHQINWRLIMSVVKNMIDNNVDYDDKKFTYNGIRSTLKYMKDIKQMDLFSAESNTVLALVPFNYNEAKQFAIECYKIRKSVEKFEPNNEVIVIKKKEKVVKDYIDMENLI